MRLSLARPVASVATATATATGVPGWLVAGSIWTGLGVLVIVGGIVVGLWFVLEGMTYFTRQPQITPYIRTWTTLSTAHVIITFGVAMGVVAVAMMALTHFLLDAIRPGG